MLSLTIFQNIMMIIAGTISITVACSWPKGIARAMFILFMAGCFLIPSITQLLTMPFAVRWGYSPSLWVYFFSTGISTLSLLPLIIFVVSAKQVFSKEALSEAKHSARDPNEGPVWDTVLSKTQIKEISTKRNLAFLVDSVPLLLLFVGALYLFGMIDQGVVSGGFGGLIPVGTILVWAYLLFKESFNGQSVGKRLLGCRAVSASTGQPVGARDSCLRNLIFMLPFMPLVELIVSQLRDDGKRLGDLWADTRVVAGPPQWIDGVAVAAEAPEEKKHPLDD